MTDPRGYLICNTCGVQYADTDPSKRTSCPVCDDPRQWVPVSGQSWTTLRQLQESGRYRNEFTPLDNDRLATKDCKLISIHTQPNFAISQRALLCVSPKGNILWDCITYIDDETIRRIKDEYGGVSAIVISHPHYYSTCLHWAEALQCPVYIAAEDEQWLMRRGESIRFWNESRLSFCDGEFVCIKAGGHFPGSSVMYWPRTSKLLVADTMHVVPSGVYHENRPQGTTSFTFMWSYPNMIPLPPDEIFNIWKAIKELDFEDAHGGFPGRDAYGRSRARVLESAKIIISAMGYKDHAVHAEVA